MEVTKVDFENACETKKVKEVKQFIKGDRILRVINNDYNNGKGSVKISIIPTELNKEGCSITISADREKQLNEFIRVFSVKTLVKSGAVNNGEQSFIIAIQPKDNKYLVEINKLTLTSAGKSICSINIILDRSEIDEIRKLLIRSTEAPIIKK